MHLADRSRRERLRVDALEDVLPRHLQLLLHHGHDLGLGERRHLVLEVGELLDELVRKETGTRGEDLPELGEGRPELLERLAQALRPFRRRERVALGALGEPVFTDDLSDLGRAGEQIVALVLFLHRAGVTIVCIPSVVLTITTVQRALCEMRFGTLPSRNSLRPLMPAFPTTSTSAFSSAAASTIACGGSGWTRTLAWPRSPAISRASSWRLSSAPAMSTSPLAAGITWTMTSSAA